MTAPNGATGARPLLVLPAYQKAQPIKKAAEQAEMFGEATS
jgi:hypothetical protein